MVFGKFLFPIIILMLCVTGHHKVPYCAIMVLETCGNDWVIIIKQFFFTKRNLWFGESKEEVSKETVLLCRVLQDTLLETPV